MFKERFMEFMEKIQEGKIFVPIIALVTFILIALFSLSRIYERIDYSFYDFYFALKPSIQEWENLVFVDIDDNSTNSLGQFPWPRHVYGQGFQTYKSVGTELAVFDIMFLDSSPLQVIPEQFQNIERYAAHGRVTPEQINGIVIDNDMEFAKAMKEMGRVVLSYSMSPNLPVIEVVELQETEAFKNAKKRFNERSSIEIPQEDLHKYASLIDSTTQSISYPIIEFMESAYSFGFVNRDTDSDGGVRRVRLIELVDNRIYFNLSMVMLLHIYRADKNSIEIVPGKHIIIKNALNPINDTISDIRIPIDDRGMMLINWAGFGPRQDSFKILPFFSLIDYDKFHGSVYNFFDNETHGRFKDLMNSLNSSIKNLYEEYFTQNSVQERREIKKEISTLKEQKSEYFESLLSPINEEIKYLQKEVANDPNPMYEALLHHHLSNMSAFEVIDETEKLQGAVALTGLTATGTVDIGKVPLSNEYAMVGVYHNVVNTILQGKYIKEIDSKLNMIIIIIFALAAGMLIQRLSAKFATISAVIGIILVNIVMLCIFIFGNYWCDPFGYTLAVFIPAAIITSAKHMNEESKRKFIKSAFSRYLAPSIIDQIIKNPSSMKLGGEQREITIFFSDVAKFSTIAEGLTPAELVHLLNEYLSAMTDIILSYGGTVDKYGGDSIMAFFGAPLDMPDHAVKACLACLDQKKKLQELRELWRSEGKNELYIRMGMNTGPAIVGNMGSSSKMDYTVMGDAVNLASRLEGVNKVYSTDIMVSETTYLMAKDYIIGRKADVVRVIGKALPVPIYEVICKKEDLSEKDENFLIHYSNALSLYESRKWKEAKVAFENVLKLKPEDAITGLYVKRCNEFSINPPSDDWDGVYAMTSK